MLEQILPRVHASFALPETRAEVGWDILEFSYRIERCGLRWPRPVPFPSGIMKDLLVLTLYSGENEFAFCKASLEMQSFREFDHTVFENLSNKVGHETLYKTIMESAGTYRRFLKLDADMVLRDPETLKEMITVFDSEREADFLSWHVLDFYSNRNILGVHMFSNRVRWNTNLPDLYIDPDPAFPGRRIIVRKQTKVPVLHSPSPSPRQAFEFGVHRAQKCFNQMRGAEFRLRRDSQFETLYGVWRAFVQSGDSIRGMAIVAAEHYRRRTIGDSAYKDNRLYDVWFESVLKMNAEQMKKFCRRYWSFRARCKNSYIKAHKLAWAAAKGTLPRWSKVISSGSLGQPASLCGEGTKI